MRALTINPGDRFGRLTVIEEAAPHGVKRCMLCHCDCGNISTHQLDNMTRGKARSCGCYRRECCAVVLAPYRFGARGG